jgi:hypothetical protein
MPDYECTPDTLDRWLFHATDGLTQESKDRVRAEITAHYEDALAAAREAGHPESEAQREALAELGDPEMARKKFCAAYLWQGDLDKLKVLESHRNRTLRSLFESYLGTLIGLALAVTISHYAFGLAWSLLGYSWFVVYEPIFDFLNGIRARFVFSQHSANTERRFRQAVTVFWGVFLLCHALLFGIILWIAPRYSGASHNQSLLIGITFFITIIALYLWPLLTRRECDIHIPLMRKMSTQACTANQKGPDQHA